MNYGTLVAELRLFETVCKHSNGKGEIALLVKNAADAIENLDDICQHQADEIRELKNHWIPVEEQFPEEYKDVLCYYEYFRYGDFNRMFRTIDRGYYVDGRWGGEAGQGYKNKVLAWMPLPEPPKDGEE